METWRAIFRNGVAPQLSTAGLTALKRALIRDDVRLTQGSTTTPPPMQCCINWPCEGACPIGFAAWQGDGLKTVGEVEEYFAKACFDCDQAIGEAAGVRHFLNAVDDWPRDEMRRELLAEVNRVLEERHAPAGLAPAAVA